MFLPAHFKKIWSFGGLTTNDQAFVEHYNKNKSVLDALSNNNIDINLNAIRVIKKSITNLNTGDSASSVLINSNEQTKVLVDNIETQCLTSFFLSDNRQKMAALQKTVLSDVNLDDPNVYKNLSEIGKAACARDDNILNLTDFEHYSTVVADTYSLSSLSKILYLTNCNETLGMLIFEPRVCFAVGVGGLY